MEGPRGSAGTRAGAGGRPQGLARLRDATPRPPHTIFAHNFPRSLLEIARKRCNSNDTTSISKQVAGELRAKLLRRRQGPRQTNFACNSVRPNFNKPRKRCNSNDANSIFEQAAGELHAKLMIDSHNWATYSNPGPGRGAGGRRQGLAGQRADAPSRKLAARTARGRAAAHGHTKQPGPAGRRPPAHTAARPTEQNARRPGTPKGRVPKYPPLTQPLPRRGSGRMDVSPGDGDASTGTCRQRRPLPGRLRR